MALRILAHHAHVFPQSVNPEGTVDRLLQLLDACNIEEAVCFAPFPDQVEARFDRNAWLAAEISNRDRLHGFGTVDIHSTDIEAQVRRIKELGLLGIKLHPNAQRFDILGPEAMSVYQAAERESLFITFHSGVHHYRLKDYNVMKFDEVAHHFPELRFSLEHVGGYHFFPEALAVIVNNIPFPPIPGRQCRVYAGLASVFTQHYNRFWYMSRDRLEELFAQVGAAQCIFGLDFPYNLEESTRQAIHTLKSLNLSEHDLGRVLGDTLRNALGLPVNVTERADPMA